MDKAFGSDWLFFLDTCRVIVILLDVWLVVWIMVTAKTLLPTTRQWGCFALSTFMVGSIYTTFTRIGHGLGVPLVVAVVGTICAAVYITQVRAHEWKHGSSH